MFSLIIFIIRHVYKIIFIIFALLLYSNYLRPKGMNKHFEIQKTLFYLIERKNT